jgi:single stranded DNA-binding protein
MNDMANGDKGEVVAWHRVAFYDRQAEIAGEILKKGRPIYVEDRLKTRKWADHDGKDNYTTEIVEELMQLRARARALACGKSNTAIPPISPQKEVLHCRSKPAHAGVTRLVDGYPAKGHYT